jgi:hypothetical protein
MNGAEQEGKPVRRIKCSVMSFHSHKREAVHDRSHAHVNHLTLLTKLCLSDSIAA